MQMREAGDFGIVGNPARGIFSTRVGIGTRLCHAYAVVSDTARLHGIGGITDRMGALHQGTHGLVRISQVTGRCKKADRPPLTVPIKGSMYLRMARWARRFELEKKSAENAPSSVEGHQNSKKTTTTASASKRTGLERPMAGTRTAILIRGDARRLALSNRT